MMHRFFRIFLLLLFTWGACSAAAKDLEEIIKTGKMRVAVLDTQTPPFMSRDINGNFQGFELDFLQECCDELGVTLELRPTERYSDLVKMVEDGEADLAMSHLSRTPKRIMQVAFTNPYAELHLALLLNRQAILIRRGQRNWEEYIRNYDGPLVVDQHSSHLAEAQKYFPHAKLVRVNNMAEVENLMTTNRLVAYLDDQTSIRSLMQRYHGSQVYFQRVILEDTVDRIAIAMPSNSPKLQAWLNSMLEQNQHIIRRIIRNSL